MLTVDSYRKSAKVNQNEREREKENSYNLFVTMPILSHANDSIDIHCVQGYGKLAVLKIHVQKFATMTNQCSKRRKYLYS